jgi:hypothetical protein
MDRLKAETGSDPMPTEVPLPSEAAIEDDSTDARPVDPEDQLTGSDETFDDDQD